MRNFDPSPGFVFIVRCLIILGSLVVTARLIV